MSAPLLMQGAGALWQSKHKVAPVTELRPRLLCPIAAERLASHLTRSRLSGAGGIMRLCIAVTASMLSFGLGARGGDLAAPSPYSPSVEATQHPGSLAQFVANQLKTGDLNCPSSDSLTYEACLLFQGALGIWQTIGSPDICPNVDSLRPFPLPASSHK